jgi:hypothetical protein
LFESKSNLEDCNLFPEDYDEYNATKRLISDMRYTEGWKFVVKQKEAMRITDCFNVFFEILNAWNFTLNNIVENKYD